MRSLRKTVYVQQLIMPYTRLDSLTIVSINIVSITIVSINASHTLPLDALDADRVTAL
jgi:hypothetical protein